MGRWRVIVIVEMVVRFRLGSEQPLSNLLADALPRRTERQCGHIFLLTIRAVCAEHYRRGDRGQANMFVESRVTLLSGARDRSPSTALNLLWRSSMPYLIAGGLYFSYHFVLSRKNRADCPYHALDGWRYRTVLWARVMGITRGGTRPYGRGRRGEPGWLLDEFRRFTGEAEL